MLGYLGGPIPRTHYCGPLRGPAKGAEFHFLYGLGTDRKENATPLLFRCPATGPKRKHHLPIVVAKQQPQNRPQSQSHVTTDDQSVSKSWIRATCESRDRILISV
jgi:hypothetical protein